MHPGVVLAIVLDGVEARQAERREREVVGIADFLDDVSPPANILQRCKPRVEERLRGRVALAVPAINRARTRIVVEVHRQLRARAGIRVASVVLLHVGLGAQQSLLLPTPDGRANRAPGRNAEALEDSHCLHELRHGVGVVARPGGRVPRVDVRAEQHDFIADLRITAGNLRDHVVAVRVCGVVACLHVGAKPHGRPTLERPHEQVVMLRGHDRRGHGILGRAGAIAQHEHRALRTLARSEHQRGAEVVECGLQDGTRQRASGHVGARRTDGHRLVVFRGLQPVLRDEGILRLGGEHDGAANLARMRLHGIDVREIPDVDRAHHHVTGGGWRPRLREGDERKISRLGHLQGEFLQRPSAAVGPRLGVDAGQAITAQGGRRPVDGLLECRAARESWADDVGEVVEQLEHVRAVHAFVADARERGCILGVGCVEAHDGSGRRGKQSFHSVAGEGKWGQFAGRAGTCRWPPVCASGTGGRSRAMPRPTFCFWRFLTS